MLLRYTGPKKSKTVYHLSRIYRFTPLCEVDNNDGKRLLSECGDIFEAVHLDSRPPAEKTPSAGGQTTGRRRRPRKK